MILLIIGATGVTGTTGVGVSPSVPVVGAGVTSGVVTVSDVFAGSVTVVEVSPVGVTVVPPTV